MKSVRFLVLGLALVSGFGAAQAADRRVTIVNATANTMSRLYASPTEGQPVDEDMLGDTILKPGQSATLAIGGSGDVCTYDLKASFSDNKTVTRKLNVCETRTYRFTAN